MGRFDAYDGNRSNARFSYQRLHWPTLRKIGEYGSVTGGSADFSASSDVKATCSFSYEGFEEPSTKEAVRIVYSFDDDSGESHESIIGTYVVSWTDRDIKATDGGLVFSGTVDGSSVLNVAKDKATYLPLVFESGTNPVSAAKALIESLGIKVYADESTTTLEEEVVFSAGTSYLEIVNGLLAKSEMGSADVDELGNVVIRKYFQKGGRTPIYTFRNDEMSIMLPSVNEKRTLSTNPNVVYLSHTGKDICVYAYARNVAGSANSISELGGREICHYENVSSVSSGDSEDAVIEELAAKAKSMVTDYATDTLTVSFSHAYIPIRHSDSIAVEYSGGNDDMEWPVCIDDMTVELTPSMRCSTTGSMSVSSRIECEIGGDSLWTQLLAEQ